jgi:hypothetical protein
LSFRDARGRVQDPDADDGGWEPEARSRGDRLAERLADRRQRRRLIMAGGGAVIVVIGLVVFFTTRGGGSQPASVSPGALITTFLPGELQKVPNACTAVPAATLDQYLPSKPAVAAPPLNDVASSECTWTIDKPIYRDIEVSLQAYSPSGLASGDGSATFAAIDAYAEAQQIKQDPGRDSGQPKAQISTLSGLGNAAFTATQTFRTTGAISNIVTEVVRYRNVLVTVVVDGYASQDSNAVTDLTTAAETIAQDVTQQLIH